MEIDYHTETLLKICRTEDCVNFILDDSRALSYPCDVFSVDISSVNEVLSTWVGLTRAMLSSDECRSW